MRKDISIVIKFHSTEQLESFMYTYRAWQLANIHYEKAKELKK